MSSADASGRPVPVTILADDLIWADRLSTAVVAAGGTPRRTGSLDLFVAALDAGGSVIVDLTARAYDGVTAIETARAAGASRILAVGQHDDIDLRRRALAAGAERVYAYRKLFEDGPATIAAWLGSPSAVPS